jgi:hypothetical protein
VDAASIVTRLKANLAGIRAFPWAKPVALRLGAPAHREFVLLAVWKYNHFEAG